MVDQPNHKSYKIRGHSRQRRSSKPYYRPNEAKNKGLLDKVKDYLNPSWLFGYFTSKEDEYEPSNVEDDASNEHATVTHEEGSTSSSYVPNQGRLDSVEEESEGDAFESFEKDNDRTISDDKTDKQAQVFDENTRKSERVANPDSSIRLSGSLDDDIEDEIERRVLQQSDRPHQSVFSCPADQLTRKPLPSLLSSRPMSSSLLLQRGTPGIGSHRNPLLGSKSARSNLYTPSVKFSTPMMSSGSSLSSPQKPNSSVTRPSTSIRNSSLRDSNVTSNEKSAVDATPRFSNAATKTETSQPVPPPNSGPLFSVEKFVTPVQRTYTNKRVGSPNYPGPVMYGGAMSVSRDVPFKRRRTTSPGSESYHPVSKLRIRGVKEKTIQNVTLGGSGTRTAQRILDALESVSSPLKDVHRIPSPISLASASPLAFKPSKSRTTPPKTKVGPRVSYLQAKLLGDPPVSSLQTPDVARVSFVEDATSEEVGPNSPGKTSKHSVEDHSFFSGLKDTVLKSSLPTSFAPKSLPTSLSPIENSSKTSGKMKTASRSAPMHYCSHKTNQDDEVVNPLPEIRSAVPLSLNPGKKMSLPMFSTNKKASDDSKLPQNNLNKQKESSTKDRLLSESPKNGFIFSTPAPRTQRFSEKEDSDVAADEVSFSFSNPVPVKKASDTTKETFKNPLLQSQASSNSFKSTVNVSLMQSEKNNSPFTRSPLTNDISFGSGKTQPADGLGKSAPAQTNDLAQQFAPAAGLLECTSCMPNNKETATKCVACETAKPTAGKTGNTGADKQEIDLKAKFAAPKDSWECQTCMIRNKNELTKCVACETIRPGTSSNEDLKLKFAAPSGSWECPTCMLQNKAADLKCVACQENKPGSSSNDSLKLKFAAPSGSWECPTCMIQNKSGDLKCVACQTSKPGAENAGQSQSGFTFNTTSANSSGFTFGGNSASQSNTTAGFTFGNSDSKQTTDTPKTSTFTFGQSSSESKKPNFTFGNNAANTTAASTAVSGDTKSTSGFTFGGGSSEKAAAVPAFTFGASSNKEENKPQFSFGAGKTERKPSQSGSLQTVDNNQKASEKLSAAPTMNIAEAAAAGLLKVPGKETPIHTPAQPSANVPVQPSAKIPAQPPTQTATNPTVPKFTFGATTAPTGPGEQKAGNETPNIGFAPLASSTTQGKPFAFQASATSTVSSTTGGLFTFGAQQSTTAPAASSSAVKSNPTGLFSFTGSTTVATSSNSVNNTSFSFTPLNPAATLPSASTTAPALATSGSASVFNFTGSTGPSVKTTLPSSQSNQPSLFTFSGSSTTEQAKPPTVFNFGAANGPTSSNGPSVTAGQTGNTLFSFAGTQVSTTPVVENQNSMGGEDMDADSNNNHDQNTFPPATGGFTFNTQTAGNASLFSAGTSAAPGGTPGGFNFTPNTGPAPTFQFGTNQGTPSGGFNFGAAPASSSPFIFGGASAPAGGTSSPSAPTAPFNFGGSSVGSKREMNVIVPTNDQPNMFNIGAGQSNRVYRKAVRRNKR